MDPAHSHAAGRCAGGFVVPAIPVGTKNPPASGLIVVGDNTGRRKLVTNKIPENPDFDTPHVVLKHDRADSPYFNWSVPAYCIPDLRYFCDNPIPPGSEYRFFGIYASERAAFAAAQDDRRMTEHGRAEWEFLTALECRLDREAGSAAL